MLASAGRRPEQLSLRKILAIWAAATLPMGAAAWMAAPFLARATGGPNAQPKALLVTLSLGLVWQFVLVVGLVYREQGSLRWSTVRAVLWLRSPESPGSGRRGGRLWLVVALMIAGLALVEAIPAIPHPVDRDLGQFLGTPAGHAFLRGAWGWLGVILVLLVFNTVLGEELLFRGLLLPRMNRVFGRFDWLANGVLFALYHVHTPWTIPAVLVDSVFLAYPARRYRSALISILAHSAQSVLILGLATALVLR
ncbi:MAG TPA: CPBP family intramembrane glutamic endopeptidase [Candidatus Dormibacteraeota bacterium]|nr:CPBP family intramembrane glutamic endopeptidase [Candidatus Dormibacteraeota bacterium]